MLLCNDEHGMSEGRVACVEISDEICIVPTRTPPVLRVFTDAIKVGRCKYAIRSHASCVGNVHWDAVTMNEGAARSLLGGLLASGWVVEQHAEDGPFADLVPKSEPSLNAVLSTLGYTTSPLEFQGKRILRDGAEVFAGTAGEVWEWLRKTGQIA